MKNNLYIIIMIVVSLVITTLGCTPAVDGRHRDSQPFDSIYTKVSAMAIYDHEPERALFLLDSAMTAGRLLSYQADLCLARIYSSCEMMKLDSAQMLCERLIELPEVKKNKYFRSDVLELLIDISRKREDDGGVLHWGYELADLCRENNEVVEALRTEAEIGMALIHLGDREEGISKLDDVIKTLDEVRRFNELDACIIAIKRKIIVLNEDRDYTNVISLAKKLMAKLDDYEKFPLDYRDESYRMPADSDKRHKYIAFYRAQAYCYLAYASARVGDMASARRFTRLFEQSDLGKTSTGRVMIAPTWFELREIDKMLAIYDEEQRAMGGDTINEDYALMLRCRAIVAQEQGNYALSLLYWKRQSLVANRLHRQKLTSKAHEYAARYHAQEQQLALQQSQARGDLFKLFTIGSILFGLLMVCFAVYFFRQRRMMDEKNRALIEQIAWTIESSGRYYKAQEAAHAKTVTEESNENSAWLQQLDSNQLFHFLSEEIVRQHMYLDPGFSRQTIVKVFNVNERLVGAAFSHSKYNSLPDFIRTCRLSHACLLLENQPHMSIGDVASSSGFTNLSVFCRDFKNRFTVTPTVYRNQRLNQVKH